MLQLGTSEHWSKALHLLSSQNKITAAAFLEYFKPLLEWLKNENSKYPNDDADFRRYIV
jgi:peptidyl-dipeptidase A